MLPFLLLRGEGLSLDLGDLIEEFDGDFRIVFSSIFDRT
jgi:hypothetical protein